MLVRPVSFFEDGEKVYRVYRIDFHSLTELELYLKSDPPVNEQVFPSQKSVYMPERFAGVPLEQAIYYCHGGYLEGFPMFMKMKRELEKTNLKTVNVRRSVPAIVGSRPHVPNFVAGTPKTMWRLDKAKEKRFIDIYINLAYSGDTTEDEIRNRGILTMNLINLFEQNSYAVNLYAFEASRLEREIFIAEIKIKKPGEVLNIGKCYYPLCGKEFVRRLLVRVKESMNFEEKWGVGYGGVLSEDLVRKCMNIGEDKILIQSPHEIGIRGKDIYKDAEAFFRYLHLTNEIKVPKYGFNHKENK